MEIKRLKDYLTTEKLRKVWREPEVIPRILKLRIFDPILFNFFYKSKELYEIKIQDIKIFLSARDKYSKSFLFSRFRKGLLHEPKVTNMLLNSIKSQKDIFVDVGTHIGYYSLLLGKALKKGKVYGFEVNKYAFEICKRNIELNNLKNTEVFNMAVSDKEGYIKIPNITYPFPGFSIKSKEKELNKIKSTTLDYFFKNKKQKPTIVKIDVEGAELLVLKGMEKILKEKKTNNFLRTSWRKIR